MSLERIHREILQFLSDNLPQDFSESGEVSRKILFQSVNFKLRISLADMFGSASNGAAKLATH